MKVKTPAANELTEQEREFAKEVEKYHAHWYIFVEVKDELISRVGIQERFPRIDGAIIRVGAIGGVKTKPSWRGQGFASAAMREAMHFIKDELKVKFGILTTYDEIAPFYHRLGWQKVEGPFVYEGPQGKTTYDGITMVLLCSRDSWPQGTIDFCGPAF